MSPLLLIELAAKSFVVSAVALLLLSALKRCSAAERSWAGHAALVAMLALPLASLVLPRWRLLPPQAAPAELPVIAASAVAPTAPATAMEALPLLDAAMLLQVVYALGAGLLLASALVAVVRLSLLRRGAAVVVEAEWLTALARAQRRMGVKYGAALLASNALSSPVSWGMLRPTILLNERLVPQHADAEAIIAHELAHVARLDWAKLLIARVVTAIFWFNPLVWVLARQCHQLREEAADDAVLRSEVPSADYAALLVQAARHECRPALIAAHGVAPGKGSLHQRVTRVLDGKMRRVPAAAGWAFACLAAATLFAGPLAAVTLEPARTPAAITIRSENSARPAQAVTLRKTEPKDRSAPRSVKPRELAERSQKQEKPNFSRAETSERPEQAEKAEQRERPERVERTEEKERPVTVSFRAQGPLPADFDKRLAITINRAMSSNMDAASEADHAAMGEQIAKDALGITPAYIKELASVGYSNLSLDELAGLRTTDVTADFIRREQKRAGRRLTVPELIDLRAR